MKHKISINRLTLACASLLLCAVFSSCGTTHIEFDIKWLKVFKFLGLLVIGAIIGALIVAIFGED